MADSLSDYLLQQLNPTLDLLQRMVAINSYTPNRAGVDAVGRLTADSFAPLGFKAELVPSTIPDYGAHLCLSRPGSTQKTIALITHLDTVFSTEEEARNNFSWRREGNRIYGPGTIDIKGGTVMCHLVLSALRQTNPRLFNEINWHLFANSSEEVLSTDFALICRNRLPPDPLAVLVFEPGGQKDSHPSIVTARKGRTTFRVDTEGRGAHAGSRHARGANAVVQMADVIGKLAALTDYDKGLTVNVGTVHGGTVVNRVPHQATADVEMRAFSLGPFHEGIRAIKALNGYSSISSAEQTHPCLTRVELLSEIPPWQANDDTDRLYELWRESAEEAGLHLECEHRGGVSDGNYFWQYYPTLDGLGPFGDHAHCSEQSPDGTKQQEYVDADSFVPRALITTRAIEKLAEGR